MVTFLCFLAIHISKNGSQTKLWKQAVAALCPHHPPKESGSRALNPGTSLPTPQQQSHTVKPTAKTKCGGSSNSLTSQPQLPTRAWEAASGTTPRDMFPEHLKDVLTQETCSLVAENKPQGTPVPYPPGENGLIASSRHLKSTSLF